ncbi:MULTISPECIES: hypothetical protein [Haloarcula]|uniref:hypothetical protein n=1 Tax=Haloarcula TaxID=2237 RepID=UPI0023E8F417|nr:hypothetical protein [Halomicroarcula sp. SHR3]
MSEETISGNAVKRDLERVADELGRAPTTTEYKELGEFPLKAVYRIKENHWRDLWKRTRYSTKKLNDPKERIDGKEDINPELIKRAAEITPDPERVDNLTNIILHKRYDEDLSGKTQNGVIAGAILYVVKELDMDVSAREVADVLSLGRIDVWSNCKDLEEDWKIPPVEEIN